MGSENIFISPSSIYHTLMLAYFGSRGETQAELTSALGFSSLGKSSVLKTYMFDRAYQAVRENTPGLGYVFKHANKLYFEKDLKLNECLRLALADQIQLVNFMRQKGAFNYYVSEELQAHVLELPYEGDHVSMLVILPPWKDDSLQETVRRMTPETMKGVIAEIKTGYGKVEKLDVMIPKFSISGSLELLEPEEKLNVSQLFGGNSNLTGFLDQYGEEKDTVSLNSAQHKSFIEVNEEGSEAAAATALLGFRSARPLFPSQFKADHPFLFLIYDKQTDTILFFGVYQHPPAP